MMNKKNNTSYLIVLANILYYIGTLFIFYLFITEDETIMWLVSILMIVLGLLTATIPDFVINLGYKDISKNILRVDLIIKITLVLGIYYTLNNRNIFYVLGITVFVGVIDIILVCYLWKQINQKNISIKELINKLEKADTQKSDGIRKYLVINNVISGIYINMQDGRIMVTICSVICLILHWYLSEKIIYELINIRKIRKYKIRILLWSVQLVMMLFSILKFELISYIVIGIYAMSVIDITMQNETAIIKLKED